MKKKKKKTLMILLLASEIENNLQDPFIQIEKK